jgi:hypothetical protein
METYEKSHENPGSETKHEINRHQWQ